MRRNKTPAIYNQDAILTRIQFKPGSTIRSLVEDIRSDHPTLNTFTVRGRTYMDPNAQSRVRKSIKRLEAQGLIYCTQDFEPPRVWEKKWFCSKKRRK